MKKKNRFLIGNWKSNMDSGSIRAWFAHLGTSYKENITVKPQVNLTVVVCPPSPYLPLVSEEAKNLPVPMWVAAQDVSPFDVGSYTGEVAASQIGEYATFVLIGHSERRKYFHETDAMLTEKTARACRSGLTPVYCVLHEKMQVPKDAAIVAYEPVWAIGTGTPDTPENAARVASAIRAAHPHVSAVLYGGSVTEDTIASYVSGSHIDGVLVGRASLNPSSFLEMIHAASEA